MYPHDETEEERRKRLKEEEEQWVKRSKDDNDAQCLAAANLMTASIAIASD